MYATCLRCERPFGTNAELLHLPVGRRVAFDTERGRLWVVCHSCGQWNLTPIEGRWEALEECERVALDAEARAEGRSAGLARTRGGLELLRLRGMPAADILNWRYGRRLRTRRLLLWWMAVALSVLACLLGVRAGQVTGAPALGLYVAFAMGAFLLVMWRRPPWIWVPMAPLPSAPRRLWSWQLQDVRMERRGEGAPPVLIAPGPDGRFREHQGHAAAAYLAALLPALNGADATGVALPDVLRRVAVFERTERRIGRRARGRRARADSRALRPWELLVNDDWWRTIVAAPAAERLALEIAVTEEVEAAALRASADALAAAWHEEEIVGQIADGLVLPRRVEERLDALRARHRSDGSDEP